MPTKIWLYYAARGRADADRTFELATTKNLIVRNALNNRGALIANVGNLRVGDQIVLAYRGRHNAPVAISTLAEPTHPHPRAPAIEVLPSERAAEIAADDYPMLDGECLEVLLLGEVRLFLLREPIPDLGRNAIHDITDSALERQVLDAANDPSGEDISTDPLDVVNLEPKPTMTSNKLSSRAIQSESGGKARLFESYIMVD